MIFLEPIIAAALGAGLTAIAVFLKTNGVALAVLKKGELKGELIKKAYDIIDPILDKNIGKWSGSQVDKAFELVVETVGDGQLSRNEILTIAKYMANKWLPASAAEKVRALEKSGASEEDEAKVVHITSQVNKG